ncbi:PepSY domain-containing protein [Paucisalibacillus globulus]|jgi:uncharacterized membrane protein YkoI|uniref:PepSY domain-containing protein n=1 Tax=Paucisalibacillus globulus TaxID=351095 RepID=UPI000417F842|nr:PepSY domain-containing protein [Paucisalibacillus globulus]
MEQALTEKFISELQAIEIAESVVEGSVVEMELDEDNGKFVYELTIKMSNGKAEVEVNARTGDIMKKIVKFNK